MIKFIRTILLVGRYNLLKKETGYKKFIPVILFVDLVFTLFVVNLLEDIVKNYNLDTLDILFIVGISVYLLSSFFAWYELFNHVADLPSEDTSDSYGLNGFPKRTSSMVSIPLKVDSSGISNRIPDVTPKQSHGVSKEIYNGSQARTTRNVNNITVINHDSEPSLTDMVIGASIMNNILHSGDNQQYFEDSNVNDNSDYNHIDDFDDNGSGYQDDDSSYNDNSSNYDDSSSYDSSDSGGSDFGGFDD